MDWLESCRVSGASNQSSGAGSDACAEENDLFADTGVCGFDGISGVLNQSDMMGCLLASGAATLVSRCGLVP